MIHIFAVSIICERLKIFTERGNYYEYSFGEYENKKKYQKV